MLSPVVIRRLQPTDVDQLLAFELANRDWFERHIDPRHPDFYSKQGVSAHIASYLTAFANGSWDPFVIVGADGAIVGRANLKDIDMASRCAEVGYRIAQQSCGQGLATLAVRHLMEQARSRWGLIELVANVHASNAASARVLARCAFIHTRMGAETAAPGDDRFVLSFQAETRTAVPATRARG